MTNDVLTYEIEKKTTLKYIQFMENLLELYPAISRVIDSFNGNVFNKRLYTALKKIPGIHAFTSSYGTIQIYVNHSYKCGNRYFNDQYYFFTMSKNDLPENKRIDSSYWNTILKKNMIHLYKDIQKSKKALDRIDFYLARLENIKDDIQDINDSIPWFMSDIFRCRCHLTSG